MRFGNPELRLRLRRIEKKPKPVYALYFQDFAIGRNQPLRLELYQIIDGIERGEGVPEANYRAGIDSDHDGLLADRGVMHLHLGGKGSDVLVFLIQYADRVVLLETNTHIHFRTQLAGRNLVALSQAWLANLEHEMADAAVQARTDAAASEREAAKDLAASRAAAIAAFKAKAGLN